MEPELSIYATVYNNRNWIKSSMESIVDKNPFFKKWELVITDNFSTDGTYEFLQKYESKYPNIKVYREKCTRGKGRQIALEHTSGKIVTYVDLDTIYLRKNWEVVNKISKIVKRKEVIGGVMYKKDVLDAGGWRDLNASEDTEFFARLAYNGMKMMTIPAVLSFNADFKKEIRESRYSKTSFGKVLRLLKHRMDVFRGSGAKFRDVLLLSHPILNIFVYSLLIITMKRSYRYFDIRNSEHNAIYHTPILPSVFGIERRFWVSNNFPFSVFYNSYRSEHKKPLENIMSWYLKNGFTMVNLGKYDHVNFLTPEAFRFLGSKLM
mgnify:CR=1 FL=1